jgi:hypothetical protein
VSDLQDFFRSYPYLGSGILSVLVFVSPYLALPLQRRTMLLSGALLLPFLPLAVVFNGSYWSPSRLAGGSFGVEDLLFTFLSASVAWGASAWPWRRSLRPQIRTSQIIGRGLQIYLLALAAFLLLRISGIGLMTSYLLAHLPIVGVLLALRPCNWRLGACGLVCYPVLYLSALSVYYRIWPGFAAEWAAVDLWGFRILGIPTGEIGYSSSFGAGWPLFVAYVSDIRGAGVGKDRSA